METGYKVMRREVLDGILRSDDFTSSRADGQDPQGRWRVYELPIAYYGRPTTRARRSPGATA
jgi:hypothetical protein